MERIVFSIDNPFDIHHMAKFYRHVDTARAMGLMSGTMEICTGVWEGTFEPSFVLLKADFDKLDIKSLFCEKQEAFMYLSSDPRQPIVVRDYNGNFIKSGKLKAQPASAPDSTLVMRTGYMLEMEA